MRPLLALAFILAFVTPGSAGHCTTWSTTEPEISVGGYYVELECVQGPCIERIRIYQETNGIEGLQRGDDVVDDTCHGMIEPDTELW